jgi:hypothetical protein
MNYLESSIRIYLTIFNHRMRKQYCLSPDLSTSNLSHFPHALNYSIRMQEGTIGRPLRFERSRLPKGHPKTAADE